MRQPGLFGEFQLQIDQSGHLTLPAEMGRQIDPEVDGSSLTIVQGQNGKLWLYPDRYFEQLMATQLVAEIEPTSDDVAFAKLALALATRVELDKRGRISLPGKMIERLGLGQEVTLIGVRDHLELWNRSDWEEFRTRLIEKPG